MSKIRWQLNRKHPTTPLFPGGQRTQDSGCPPGCDQPNLHISLLSRPPLSSPSGAPSGVHESPSLVSSSMGNWDGLLNDKMRVPYGLPDPVIRLLFRISDRGSQADEIIQQRAGAQRPARLSQGVESKRFLVCDFSPVWTKHGQSSDDLTGRRTAEPLGFATSGCPSLSSPVLSLSVFFSVPLASFLSQNLLLFYLYLIFLN